MSARMLAIGPDVGLLRPCPFCGGDAALEPDPWLAEGFRIACGSEACGVKPRTESLLACYADELCAAWNGRAPAGAEKIGLTRSQRS